MRHLTVILPHLLSSAILVSGAFAGQEAAKSAQPTGAQSDAASARFEVPAWRGWKWPGL